MRKPCRNKKTFMGLCAAVVCAGLVLAGNTVLAEGEGGQFAQGPEIPGVESRAGRRLFWMPETLICFFNMPLRAKADCPKRLAA